ncbi:hypothetical protein [Rhodanobacter glycinis]|uniref:hypothetical protein n=1 Tax=Rhodanobacter glycinis TaxID=582702 RepID=UPI00112A7B6E|nr:hypothetical protein [Rhodanobacter glycinis]
MKYATRRRTASNTFVALREEVTGPVAIAGDAIQSTLLAIAVSLIGLAGASPIIRRQVRRRWAESAKPASCVAAVQLCRERV